MVNKSEHPARSVEASVQRDRATEPRWSGGLRARWGSQQEMFCAWGNFPT